jgi:hypothetical protein
MRENRPSGSEGGAGAIPLFLPLSMAQASGLQRSVFRKCPNSRRPWASSKADISIKGLEKRPTSPPQSLTNLRLMLRAA